MLTDIFASRYENRPIWTEFREADRMLLVQGFRVVAEQLFPPNKDGKFDAPTTAHWKSIHSRLSMELGRESLSPLSWNYTAPNGTYQWNSFTIDFVCKNFMLVPFKEGDPDTHMKERVTDA